MRLLVAIGILIFFIITAFAQFVMDIVRSFEKSFVHGSLYIGFIVFGICIIIWAFQQLNKASKNHHQKKDYQ